MATAVIARDTTEGGGDGGGLRRVLRAKGRRNFQS